MHHEAQVKAFEEIDRVIGHDRLPTLADLDDLPYLEAIWKETLRWSPPLPISKLPNHHFHDKIMIQVVL
jgi:cytochrome P450